MDPDQPLDIDDDRKVFVSRLPLEWNETHLAEHFTVCFGPVESATVKWDQTNECSKGYGFVTFVSTEHRDQAVAQISLHAKKRNIHIQAVVREEDKLGRGRDGGVCYLWQKFSCVKGDNCRFSHEGEGGCIKVSEHRQGLKKCVSFKAKGKCSKGDACPFAHERKSNATSTDANSTKKVSTEETGKICHSFKKKGKCRKGDKCIFSHDMSGINGAAAEVEKAGGKRRIDGSFLVEARKKIQEQQLGTMEAVDTTTTDSKNEKKKNKKRRVEEEDY